MATARHWAHHIPIRGQRATGPHAGIDIAAVTGTPVIAPQDLKVLKVGFGERPGRFVTAETIREDGSFDGDGYRVTFAHSDLLATKLFAYCDRDTDFADCVALAPTSAEVEEVTGWIEYQDANPSWPAHVQSRLRALLEALNDV